MQHRSTHRSPWRYPFFFLSLCFFLISLPSWAATISKVKGKNVLISLDGSEFSKGESVYAVDSNGKPKALIQITKTSSNKAIGKVTKGKVSSGMEVLSKDEARERKSGSKSSGSGSKGMAKKSKYSGGLILSMNKASMNVALGSTTAALSGSGTGFSVFGDLNYWESISIRASVGIEKFSAEGEVTDNSCTESGNTTTNVCTTSINYLALSAIARYTFFRGGSYSIWGGGGLAILNPSSAESTAVDVDSIKTTSAYIVGAGSDIWVNGKIYVPVQLTYNLLPSSEDVTAKYLSIKVGAGYQF